LKLDAIQDLEENLAARGGLVTEAFVVECWQLSFVEHYE